MELFLDEFNEKGIMIHEGKSHRGCFCRDWNIYIQIDKLPGILGFPIHQAKRMYIERIHWPVNGAEIEHRFSTIWQCSLYCVGCGHVRYRNCSQDWAKQEAEKRRQCWKNLENFNQFKEEPHHQSPSAIPKLVGHSPSRNDL